MSGYRNEWPCCGDETYTEAWEPERCPFCELNDAKDRIAELETELEAAQAPVSGEVEPVAWANVLEWMESPLIYPFAYKAQAEAAADRNSGTVRPLIFGDTHPPAKVPEWWVADIREAAKHIAEFESGPSQLAGSLFRISDALLTTPTPATTPEAEWVKPTGRKHHDLKTDPSVFRQSLNGVKPWEIRRNDRDFVRGDTVTLHETENTGEEMAEGAPLIYTGRKITGVIGFVLNGPAYGLKPDWCVFSLLPTPPQEQ